MNGRPLLSLQDLRFRYRPAQHWILNGLTARAPGGAITAVLGPNGVGKTTLLHILIGFLPFQSGTIDIDGRPLRSLSRREMSRLIALVPQLEQIPFPYTVREYASMGRAPHLGMLHAPNREDNQRTDEVLSLLGLHALADKPVQELSGGESHLVRIARAMVQECRILLLDEPTAHLDLANRDRVLRILQDLAARCVTVIFTTHDPCAAFAIAQHAILLQDGRALASGSTEQVLDSANLSRAYALPLKVLRVDGRFIVLRRRDQP
jgi:iron complex transport system ATP-binding protein